jgi:hypothetical protein
VRAFRGGTLANGIVNCLLVLLPLVAIEGAFRLLPVSKPPYILPVSAQAPVAHFQPNMDYVYSRDWNFSVRTDKRSNNFGFINQADYRPEETTPLLVMIGDSYVEAHTIAPGKSAAELLHSTLGGAGRVYSIGLSGAPLSQYLAFAQFARTTFRPDAMAFVIIGNDFDESLLKYKSDQRFHYFTQNGELRRVDYEMSATKKILRGSAFLRYLMLHLEPSRVLYNLRRLTGESGGPASAERTADSEKAIDYFFDQLPSKSGLESESILFVLDALRPAIYSSQELQQAEDGYGSRMRRYFMREANARGYAVLDMQPVFIARHELDGSRFEAGPSDGHWSALGHWLAAEEIQKSALFARAFRASNSARHTH